MPLGATSAKLVQERRGVYRAVENRAVVFSLLKHMENIQDETFHLSPFDPFPFLLNVTIQ